MIQRPNAFLHYSLFCDLNTPNTFSNCSTCPLFSKDNYVKFIMSIGIKVLCSPYNVIIDDYTEQIINKGAIKFLKNNAVDITQDMEGS